MFGLSGWSLKGVFLLLLGCGLAFNVSAMDAPESITIDALAEYYEPVEFDHQLHVGVASDCSVCHHHTTGTGTLDPYCGRCHSEFKELDKVSCQDCHSADPFSAEQIKSAGEKNLFHVDINGLKGAYHQSCLGCHVEMDGPSGCQDCHPRNEQGDKLFHAGKYAPQGDKPAKSH